MRSFVLCFCSLLVAMTTWIVPSLPHQFTRGATESWQLIPTPLPPAGTTYFFSAVAASGPRDAWMVGTQNSESQGSFLMAKALIEHWDGRSWKVVPSPETGSQVSILRSVAVASAHCAIAVGVSYPSRSGSGKAKGLIEQWDGSHWRVRPAPDAGSFSELNSVSMDAQTHTAWAVGTRGEPNDQRRTALVDAFDGSQWRRIDVPLPVSRTTLTQVSAFSSQNVWASGVRDDTAGLLLHFDGRQWSLQQPAMRYDYLITAVLASSAQHAWSVGGSQSTSEVHVEHWTGQRWEGLPHPVRVGEYADYLASVLAFSERDVWVLGAAVAAHTSAPLVQHWDGRSWQVVAVPPPPFPTQHGGLWAARIPGQRAFWALGYTVERSASLSQLFLALYQQDLPAGG